MDVSAHTRTSTVYVFPFGAGFRLPPQDRLLLGGKGQHLAEMASIGLPVPPGFIITTFACVQFLHNQKRLPEGLEHQIEAAVQILESQMSAKLGDERNPLLVSVRSGAAISMPGMMDTILDLGLNDRTVVGFAERMKNERLAYDCYRRFIALYGSIVHGLDREIFSIVLDEVKTRYQSQQDIDLNVEALKDLCSKFKGLYEQHLGKPFPQDTHLQLLEAIGAVFSSWESKRAELYRKVNHIANDLGTAVILQSMVFGNRNERSATGVGFTRDPSTGENIFYGEFLLNAQGEDVVAGIRTPQPINCYQKKMTGSNLESLEEAMPEVYAQLKTAVGTLERYYCDMQDIEFTIDDGRLFMLQTRSGKRSGFAAVRMAVDMLNEGLIDEVTALRRVDPEQIEQLLVPVFHARDKEVAQKKMVAKGLNAGPGAASGVCALTSIRAMAYQQQGIPCILVRTETNPDDFPGMVIAEGILTARGGSSSHAAVVARGMGKPCVCGCSALDIDLNKGSVSASGQTIKEGDAISIDGSTGEVFFCRLNSSPSEIVQVLLTKDLQPDESRVYQYYHKIMALADKYRKLEVRANADSCHESVVARAFGGEGIGLCRTEHMFLEDKRLLDVRKMLFSTSVHEREEAIRQLLPDQKEDFKYLFRGMHGLPVTIRLLDPPLHEFLPQEDAGLTVLAQRLNVDRQRLVEIARSLDEHNPMLGFRGCRLGILNPGLTRIQAQAIFEAAVEVTLEGCLVYLEIMVPLVCTEEEFLHQKALIDVTAEEVFGERGLCITYHVGAMIELPRACLMAGKLANSAQFFSFGTNDLTQTTFGMSRDDANRFLPMYIDGVTKPGHQDEKSHLLIEDPFQSIDQEGVGELMRMAVERGRKTRPQLKCGICGEHGGDPRSVVFCHQIGLDYVSCSPYRIPVARLAAARAAIG